MEEADEVVVVDVTAETLARTVADSATAKIQESFSNVKPNCAARIGAAGGGGQR